MMATPTKRGRGRPKGTLNKQKENSSNAESFVNPYHNDAFSGYRSQPMEYTGDINHTHPSIIKEQDTECETSQWVNSILPRQTCFYELCHDEHFHCPLCPVAVTEYDSVLDLETHFLKLHAYQHFSYSDHKIVLCNLGCLDSFISHYHCPKCGHKSARNIHMRNHLTRCTTITHPSPPVPESEEPIKKRPRSSTGSSRRVRVRGCDLDNLWDYDYNQTSDSKETLKVLPLIENGVSRDEDPSMSTKDITNQSQNITSMVREVDRQNLDLDRVNDISLKSIEMTSNDNNEDSKSTKIDQTSSDGQNISVIMLEGSEEGQTTSLPETDSINITLAPDSLQNSGSIQTGAEGHVEQLQNPHKSIVRRLEDLECRRCQTCCDLFHCPLCAQELYSPKAPKILCKHIRSHFNCSVSYEGWTCMKCNLACDTGSDNEIVQAHWHCPLCPQKKLHRTRLREHLKNHLRGRTRICQVRKFQNHSAVEKIAHEITENDHVVSLNAGDSCKSHEIDVNEGINNVNCVTTNAREKQLYLLESDSNGTNAVFFKMENAEQMEAKFNKETNSEDYSIPEHTLEGIELNVSLQRQLNEETSQIVSGADKIIIQNDDGTHQVVYINSDQVMVQNTRNDSKTGSLEALGAEPVLGGETSITAMSEEQPTVGENRTVVSSDPEAHVVALMDDVTVIQEENEIIENDEQETAQVFQSVAGLLTPDLTHKLGDFLDQFLAQLEQMTGISIRQQEAETPGHLLQGSWSQLDKCRIVLEQVTKSPNGQLLDVSSVMMKVHQDHPDLFPDPVEAPDPLDEDSMSVDNEGTDSDGDNSAQISPNEPCPYCQKRFRYKLSLFTHILSRHNPCRRPARNWDKWRGILRRMTKITSPQCPKCGKKFTKLLHAKVHYSSNVCSIRQKPFTRAENGRYPCKECSYMAMSLSLMNQHVKFKHTEKTIPCPSCDKLFATVDILRNHVKKVHRGETLCTVCGVHVQTYELIEHMKSHEEEINTDKVIRKIIQCSQCDYCTTEPQSMKFHMVKRHNTEAYKCKHCDETFSIRSQLYAHMRTHGLQRVAVADLYANCPVCSKKMLKRNINAHVRLTHRSERRYKCVTCSKAFQTKYVLDIHMQTHIPGNQRTYRFNCSYCNMGFHSKTILQDHIFTHTNVRPYTCNICGNSFRQKTVYQRHLVIHSPSRFFCEICQESYSSKYTLKQHMKKHQTLESAQVKTDLIIVCGCGQTFSGTSALKEHTGACPILQDQRSQGGDAQVPIVTTDGEGNTVIIIQPEQGEDCDSQNVTDSLRQVLGIGSDGRSLTQNIHNITEITTDDISMQDISISDLTIMEQAQMNLQGVHMNDSPIVAPSVENSGENNGYLCGYCNTVFNDLSSVQSHIVMEHGDQLPVGDQPQIEVQQ